MEYLDKLTRSVDTICKRVGQLGAWFLIPIISVVMVDVVTRRFFTLGSVTLQELEWHFHAIVFLLCSSWTYLNDGHVRVDIFYARLSRRGRAATDLLTSVFFFIFAGTLLATGWVFLMDSVGVWEVSFRVTIHSTKRVIPPISRLETTWRTRMRFQVPGSRFQVSKLNRNVDSRRVDQDGNTYLEGSLAHLDAAIDTVSVTD